MSSPLHLDVFVVPYKPIAGLIPQMSKGEPTSTSATHTPCGQQARASLSRDRAASP